ncbi:hypothetical protein [Clostridium sp.]|uniref:hypothetical protein n=1 Tax=Clostridium sp. TaxID=1506 RepID=UPI0026DDBB14|nr:hypothetical protein [Clostridium sp.]MDO5039828.1 hypothetical protein [Clostridium sp.]
MIYALILVISISVIVFLIFSYEKKLNLSRKQLIVANSQINKLKKYAPSHYNTKGGLSIKFSYPENNFGIIKENSKVFISPLDNSYIIQILNVKMEVKILDKAEVGKDTWYYISLPIDSNINSRGWIKSTCFSYLYSNSNSVINNLNNKA